jgi:hypothetical protein
VFSRYHLWLIRFHYIKVFFTTPSRSHGDLEGAITGMNRCVNFLAWAVERTLRII